MSKISAAERLGLVFLFVILAQYDESWQILHSTYEAYNAKTEREDELTTTEMPPVNLPAVLSVFEAMLCFDQWLNQTTYWTMEHHAESKVVVQRAIKTLMSMCVNDIPLSKSKLWKFPKFHELFHIPKNMERFGASINYCAQRPESLLIPVAKKPGRRAQKRHNGSAYELQSAQRLSYSLMINAVYTRRWDTSHPKVSTTNPVPCIDNQTNKCGTGNSTFATLTCDYAIGYRLCWHTQTKESLMHILDNVLQYVIHQFGSHVKLCTELKYKTATYHCHPSYQSGGPIYDWMNVTFTHANTRATTLRPCRLAVIVVTKESQTYCLVFQCGARKTGIKSVFLTEWEMSNDFTVIEPCNIDGLCFVIMIKEDESKVLPTLPRHLYASEFTEPVDKPTPVVNE